jgi:hypothetical protein
MRKNTHGKKTDCQYNSGPSRPKRNTSHGDRFQKPRGKKIQTGIQVRIRPKRDQNVIPVEAPRAKVAAVEEGLKKIWEQLFTSPIHLDSSLSKIKPKLKSILAQIVPRILLRPVSEAESLGVGVPAGEPWVLLGKDRLSTWRPALLMASRIYEMMDQRLPSAAPVAEDFPSEMVDEWLTSWGPSTTGELVDALGKEPPLSLRASRKIGAQGLISKLTSASPLPVKIEASTVTPLGVRLSGYTPVLGTEAYEEGNFEIQDEGSQLMALFALWPERYGGILQAKPGKVRIGDLPAPPLPKEAPNLTVIDTCAGAGGKSLALADALKGKGESTPTMFQASNFRH